MRETDAGLVISGKIGMHTSPAFAEDVFIGGQTGIEIGAHRATFIVPVGAPGVTTVCRKIAVRDANPFVAPLSSRYDELDGQMWLDDVFIPWERIFLLDISPEPIARWLVWHQLYCWLSKAEFTLGLALACTHAMGLMEHERRSTTCSTWSSTCRRYEAARPRPSAIRNSPRRAIVIPTTAIWPPAASPH